MAAKGQDTGWLLVSIMQVSGSRKMAHGIPFALGPRYAGDLDIKILAT